MNKGELAKDYFSKGNNCSVSVVLAFKDEIGLDENMLKKAAIGFGGGFARQRLTCGAVSGMAMVLSFLLSDGENKTEIYSVIQNACQEFKSQVGSIICGELLSVDDAKKTNPVPDDRTKEYYAKRPCGELCKIAADIADKIIKEKI